MYYVYKTCVRRDKIRTLRVSGNELAADQSMAARMRYQELETDNWNDIDRHTRHWRKK